MQNADDYRESPTLQMLELQERHLARLLKCYDPFLIGNKIAENQYDDFDEFFDDVDKVVITASEQVERWLSMTTSSRIGINPRAW